MQRVQAAHRPHTGHIRRGGIAGVPLRCHCGEPNAGGLAGIAAHGTARPRAAPAYRMHRHTASNEHVPTRAAGGRCTGWRTCRRAAASRTSSGRPTGPSTSPDVWSRLVTYPAASKGGLGHAAYIVAVTANRWARAGGAGRLEIGGGGGSEGGGARASLWGTREAERRARAAAVESRRACPVESRRACPIESRRACPIESRRACPIESRRAWGTARDGSGSRRGAACRAVPAAPSDSMGAAGQRGCACARRGRRIQGTCDLIRGTRPSRNASTPTILQV